MRNNSIFKKSKEIAVLFSRNDISVYAANSAFFVFLSFIPFVMVLFSIVPYLPFNKMDFVGFFEEYFPQILQPFVTMVVDDVYSRSYAILSISAVFAIWSAGRGILGLTRGLNKISGVFETRNYVILRLLCCIYTVIIIIAIVIIGGIFGFGEEILFMIRGWLPKVSKGVNILFTYRDFTMIVMVFGLILFCYCILPNVGRSKKIRGNVLGALLSSCAWWLFTKLFSVYIAEYNGLSMYGSLTFLIITLLWLYAGMYFFFVGAQVNRIIFMEKNKSDTVIDEKNVDAEKGYNNEG